MSDIQNTLTDLRWLLARLPGVSVESSDVRPRRVDLVFRIEQIESIGPIVYACDGANVTLNVWSVAHGAPAVERANPSSVRYRISARADSDASNLADDRLMAFGVYLVNYAHAISVIAPADANKLLKAWNGQAIPPVSVV